MHITQCFDSIMWHQRRHEKPTDRELKKQAVGINGTIVNELLNFSGETLLLSDDECRHLSKDLDDFSTLKVSKIKTSSSDLLR